MSRNKINSLDSDLVKNSAELVWVELADNCNTDIYPSMFRNNSRLLHLCMSGNEINSIQPDTFIHNMELELVDLDDLEQYIVCPSDSISK
jgi:Leucine-rich repeat (LRR) protein